MIGLKIRLLAILILIMMVFPNGVFAYTYGDPNKEEVAETFKLIVSKLNNSDWAGASAAHKVRRSEISAHFGESVAVTLDVNLEAKDKKAVIANYQAVLIMNLERRFDYGLKDINDYSKAKLLLAKAKGTYDVLESYVDESVPKDKINASFELALEALGNPGLFGVGEKPVNPDVFKKETAFIYNTLKPLFPYKEAKKSTSKTTIPTPKKTEQKPITNTKKQETKTSTQQKETSAKTTTEPKQQTTDNSTSSKKVKEEEKETESLDKQLKNEEVEKQDEQKAEEVVTEDSKPSIDENTTLNQEDSSVEEAKENVNEVATDVVHAPMERTKKTNSAITIAIFIGMFLVGAGTIWFVKRKGII